MKKIFILTPLLLSFQCCFCWGFFAHRRINYYAVFLLPPEMMLFYKPNINFLSDHATDPDKRRYAIAEEGPRHYIDMDHYGPPYDSLPRKWDDAVKKFTGDSLNRHGIVPWWIQVVYGRLIKAFKEKDGVKILKLSAEIGHYIADAHVPLHTSSNHNGQFTNQRGIHGFWESRIPELLADNEWDFFIGKASYIKSPLDFTWKIVFQSAAAADTVLRFEKELTNEFRPDQKFSFEYRDGVLLRQYASGYCRAYDKLLNGMIERRMRLSIFAVACFWYTAWVEAGQPNLSELTKASISTEDQKEFEDLNQAWRNNEMKGREEERP